MPKYEEPRIRFARKVKIDARSGCWIWTASKCGDGYGYFRINRKTVKAHRASYQLFKGDPKGFYVLHTCHNASCVNPNHLKLGTHEENMQDLVKSGRRKRCKK